MGSLGNLKAAGTTIKVRARLRSHTLPLCAWQEVECFVCDDMEPVPEALKAFIFANFETVDQLRVLLLLQANPERTWGALLVSSMLHLQLDVAQANLQFLCQKSFLALSDDTGHQYRYQPANAEMAQMVQAVAGFDRARPVTLIRLIYTRPSEVSQTSAESTKSRKDG